MNNIGFTLFKAKLYCKKNQLKKKCSSSIINPIIITQAENK